MAPSSIAAADRANASVGRAQLELLVAIVGVDDAQDWRDDGARDVAHWASMRYGISHWKASRWVAAGRALGTLPRLAEALADGTLSLDKVVELARFVSPQTESNLIRWAREVATATVRRRADLEVRRARDEIVEVERTRMLNWWYFDDGRRFGMEVDLAAAEGAVVAKALERLVRSIPVMPGEDDAYYATARRADALVAMCSARVAADPDPDRATVVVHAQAGSIGEGAVRAGEIEDGPAIDPVTVERMLCNARVQRVVEDERGNVIRLGETSRIAPAWMERQVRYRDRGCRFPGCGVRRFTEAHHIRWWRDGGRTTLENLALICSFHHRLVHEHGWRIERLAGGDLAWRRPDGIRMRAGPPPRAPAELEHIA